MRIDTVKHVVPAQKITNATVLEAIRSANEHRLTAKELTSVLSQVEKFMAMSGTRVRYFVDNGQKPLDCVLDAARQAMGEQGVRAGEIDFVIYAGVGRGWLEPATANVIQHALKLEEATCFDILDACASWLRALQIAHTLIRGRVYRRGLIVNGECGLRRYADLDLSKPSDISDRLAAFTIGEAATATLVSDDDPDDDFHFRFRNFGEHYDLCMIPLENAADFASDGSDWEHTALKFYAHSPKLTTATIERIVETFESDPKLRDDKFSICFGHAASERASQIVGQRLGLAMETYYSTHADYGNTVSASVPLGMSLALADGRIRRGDKTLVVVGSAGVSVGLASFTF